MQYIVKEKVLCSAEKSSVILAEPNSSISAEPNVRSVTNVNSDPISRRKKSIIYISRIRSLLIMIFVAKALQVILSKLQLFCSYQSFPACSLKSYLLSYLVTLKFKSRAQILLKSWSSYPCSGMSKQNCPFHFQILHTKLHIFVSPFFNILVSTRFI